ncbi:putative endonuclease 4 [Pseudolycoriella hygida]|uniref:Endonuclease 4 n=1 Tax=Pseudolycoriella hygida TaxID=35572 RepID=A0A9Q0NE49_9DIPT|nr:putative endonuclease 4 [Pseudolycoriella hygida]
MARTRYRPRRPRSSTKDGEAKIPKTSPLNCVTDEIAKKIEEEIEEEIVYESEDQNVPKGEDGKIDYKAMTNILPKDFAENSKTNVFIGAHLPISGGIENAIIQAGAIGAQAVAMFLCSQLTWNVEELDDTSVAKFKKACEDYGFPSHLIVPHASYIMNPGSGDKEILNKSRNLMIDGLSRCDRLGIDLYNFHPGSTGGRICVAECISNIAETINIAHKKTKTSIAVIENMCKQGNTVGGDFKQIKKIIDLVEDKSRVGVCIDTCHAFAAGYNLKTEEGFNKMMEEFENIIGINYLKAVHLSDSKEKCNSRVDRHANIGRGKIGLEAFKRMINDPRFKNIPMVLETPFKDTDPLIYKKEVKLLYKQIELNE